MNRREFLQLSFLSPFVLVVPKVKARESEQGLIFPMQFAEKNERHSNSVTIKEFEGSGILHRIWLSIMQSTK